MIIDKYGIKLRTVEVEDAEFILSLRLNDKLSRYLSPTTNSIVQQENWINKYKKREKKGIEYYFVTIDNQGNKYGLSRIYDFEDNSFESGSWLFSPDAPKGYSILSDLAGRDYGFEVLGFEYCRFNVKKKNSTVVNYSLAFKPNLLSEDEFTYFFRIDYAAYKKHRDRLIRMLVRK